jgi:hypothetical protein
MDAVAADTGGAGTGPVLLELAGGRAAVIGEGVGVVTRLIAPEDPVSAEGGTGGAADGGRTGTGEPFLHRAGGGAAVAGNQVPIVTWFLTDDLVVSALGSTERGAGGGGGDGDGNGEEGGKELG